MILRKAITSAVRNAQRNRLLHKKFSEATYNNSKNTKEEEAKDFDEEEQRQYKEEQYEYEHEEDEEEEYEYEDDEGPRFKPFSIIGWAGFGVFCYNYYLNLYSDVPKEAFGHIGFVANGADWTHDWILTCKRYLLEPPSTKLLYDSGLPPHMRKKVLVIKLEDLLIAKKIQFGKGPEIRLRNKAKAFLAELGKIYDIVIFSDQRTEEAEMIFSALDPTSNMTGPKSIFGNEYTVTKVKGGTEFRIAQRNLEHLNRSLKDVLVVDFSKNTYSMQPENVLVIPKFDGESSDDDLQKASLLLKHLNSKRIKDVRAELAKLDPEAPHEDFYKIWKARQEKLKNRLGAKKPLVKRKKLRYNQQQRYN